VPDTLDRAIAKALGEAVPEEQTVTMADVPVTISSTGRPAILSLPVDLTDVELHELAAFLLLAVPAQLARARGEVRSRLIVPT
jgi:hypothetical protein